MGLIKVIFTEGIFVGLIEVLNFDGILDGNDVCGISDSLVGKDEEIFEGV